MRHRIFAVTLAAALAALLSACSARTQLALQDERRNGAHFATWSHMAYSLERGTPQTTTRRDIHLAQADRCLPDQLCKWWGEPVEVQPIQ